MARSPYTILLNGLGRPIGAIRLGSAAAADPANPYGLKWGTPKAPEVTSDGLAVKEAAGVDAAFVRPPKVRNFTNGEVHLPPPPPPALTANEIETILTGMTEKDLSDALARAAAAGGVDPVTSMLDVRIVQEQGKRRKAGEAGGRATTGEEQIRLQRQQQEQVAAGTGSGFSPLVYGLGALALVGLVWFATQRRR